MQPEQPTPSVTRFPTRFSARLAFLLLVLGLVGGILVYRQFFPDLFSTAPASAPKNDLPQDPRRTYQGPFQNIDPEVRYVGMDACSTCHANIAATYLQHPMARSLLPIARLASSQQYGTANHNPFKAFDSVLRVDAQGNRVWHRQSWQDEKGKVLLQKDMEVHYAIGSGLHGHSYLTVEGAGFLVQTPISWFSQKKIWDVSPGFVAGQRRTVMPECMFCHANRALPKEGYTNGYEAPIFSGHAIGCERCHGPGEKHVQDPGLQAVSAAAAAAFQDGVKEADLTIVNPGKLKTELRESVCQQCHLEGESRIIRRGRGLYDFRPGLPLDEFWSIFIRGRQADEDKKAVNHVDQMYLSRCFQRSDGNHKLGCISCHNPHEHVGAATRLEHYRQRCLRCHTDGDRREGSRLPCAVSFSERRRRNQNDCAACHMPPYATSDIVHAASTDHRILRRPEKLSPPEQSPGRPATLVHFHRGAVEAGEKELSRDLALAWAPFVLKTRGYQALPEVIDLLETTLQDFRTDLPVWEAKTKALMLARRHAEALAAAETILKKKPENEMALNAAGMAALLLGEEDLSVAYWRRVVALNPYVAERRHYLAEALVKKQAWEEAGQHCREWLRLDPTNIDARRILIDCLLRTGKRSEARAEFALVEALRLPALEKLQVWFVARMAEGAGK